MSADRMSRDNHGSRVTHRNVYVIGAGIIGAACGINLARRGLRVHFIDHRQPGTAASYGNAGAVVSWGAIPEAAPEVFRKALRWMLEKDGFVKMQPRYLSQMAEWLWHYHKARRSDLRETSAALSRLVAHSQRTLWPTVAETGTAALFARTGGLSVYDREADLRADLASRQVHALAHGVDPGFQALSPDELFQLEPDLPRQPRFGLLSPGDAALRDPAALVRRWFARAIESDGRFVVSRVTGFETAAGRITTIRGDDGTTIPVSDGAVVIAAGAWSHRLATALGERVPLRASRGYHLSFPEPGLAFRRTILFEGYGFMMNHMTPGLRFAGTVEYDDPDRPANPRRVENLRRRVFRCLPSLEGEPHETWVGARPSLPDSLPVISGSRRYANAFFAFGHGSLGVTNASASGALVADLVTGQEPAIPVGPYRIDRFRLP